MADKTNGPRLTDQEPSQTLTQTASQDTARCACPRSGDLWQCAGRPEMVSAPDGRRCELGELARLGTDHDVRGPLAAALGVAGGGDNA
jgi:hypothetical protein